MSISSFDLGTSWEFDNQVSPQIGLTYSPDPPNLDGLLCFEAPLFSGTLFPTKQIYLNKARNGIVWFSFGSTIPSKMDNI